MIINKQHSEGINAIDGLRGICELIVVMGNFAVAFFPSSYWGECLPSHTVYSLDTHLAQSPLSIFYAGNYEVCIFLQIYLLIIVIEIYFRRLSNKCYIFAQQ